MAGYWERKQELAEKARLHVKEMYENYGPHIEATIRNVRIYGGPDGLPKETSAPKGTPETIVADADSVTAVYGYAEGRTAVLNFASYKNPGGMFRKGSSAQEESLCHESTLYNVLKGFDGTYYAWNREHLYRSMYSDRALYAPNVVFKRNGRRPIYCSVITCAAPNMTAAIRNGTASKEENMKFLASRIAFIRRIAEERGVETLILGAFGCGVFGQDPIAVATLFKKEFSETTVRKIVYAVPAGPNLEAFKRVFEIRSSGKNEK